MTETLEILRDVAVEGWRPALEVTILAVVIYRIFLFLRGTRGWAVVLGLTGVLVLILSLTVLTNLFGLTVLNRVIGWLLVGLPLAALVVFQPELRRALAEFGNLPLFNTNRQERETIEVLVRATERMAKLRMGALIAVEQATQLRGAVESGVAIDCVATPEMFETIFFPKNAIHDGGVLLQADRITHAACIFPLTQRSDLDKTIGTRHRAAIGLTEETDAVVVIVSEETGAISYAYKGYLEKGVTLNELRAFLTTILFKQTAHRPKTWRAWFRSQNRNVQQGKVRRKRRKRSKTEDSQRPEMMESPVSKTPTGNTEYSTKTDFKKKQAGAETP